MKKASLSERDIDRLLSGRNLADGSEDRLAAFFCSARRDLALPPDEKVEAAHLAAILAAARPRPSATILPSATAGKTAARRSLGLRLRAAAAKVAVGALGLTTGTAGLAMAGMDLPGTIAEKAFGAVGISLPNQGHDDSGSPTASETSERVREAIEGREASTSGCAFGARVSRAARGLPDEGDPEHCNPPGREKANQSDRAGSGRGPKQQPAGKTKDHPGQDSNSGTGGTPPGQDGTTGRPDTPPGLDKKEENAPTPPDPQTDHGNGGTNPGGRGDPPGETKKQEAGETAPGQDGSKPGKGGSSSIQG